MVRLQSCELERGSAAAKPPHGWMAMSTATAARRALSQVLRAPADVTTIRRGGKPRIPDRSRHAAAQFRYGFMETKGGSSSIRVHLAIRMKIELGVQPAPAEGPKKVGHKSSIAEPAEFTLGNSSGPVRDGGRCNHQLPAHCRFKERRLKAQHTGAICAGALRKQQNGNSGF
jgi:hypothetical protein